MHFLLISKKQLLDLINQKYTIFQIVKETGLCKNTIKNYLKKYKINTPKGFYSTGLVRKKRIPHTDKWRQEMSVRFKGENNPFYGKKHTQKTRKKMIENHADFKGDNNPFKQACIKNPELKNKLRNIKLEEWNKLDIDARYQRTKKVIYKDISKNHWSNIESNAKTRGLEFKITPKYIWFIWERQNGICAYSGVNLNIKSIYEITASLDRIDSTKGYIEDNVQWIHKNINIMKNNLPHQDFIDICYKIVENDLKNVKKSNQ